MADYGNWVSWLQLPGTWNGEVLKSPELCYTKWSGIYQSNICTICLTTRLRLQVVSRRWCVQGAQRFGKVLSRWVSKVHNAHRNTLQTAQAQQQSLLFHVLDCDVSLLK